MVTITDLNVKGEDFIFDGDVRLLGNVHIEDGSLIVNGHLTLGENGSMYIKGGDLIAKSITVRNNSYDYSFYVEDGDIHVTEGSFNVAGNIEVLGDIFIENGNLIAYDISSFILYVNGTVESSVIKTLEDIFFLKGHVFNVDCGRDFHIENHCDFNNCHVSVKGNFTCNGELENIDRLSVKGMFRCDSDITDISDVSIG